jgi:heat shock factor-binding protein 1
MQQSPGLNTSTDSSAELAAVVDDLLNQLNTKFTTISSDLLSKSELYPSCLNVCMCESSC